MLVVRHLNGGVHSQGQSHFFTRTVVALDAECGTTLRAQGRICCNVYALVDLQTQHLPRIAWQKLEWQRAHAHQIAAVNALKASRHHGPHAQQARALGRPVARRTGAVFLARKDHRGHLGLDEQLARFKNIDKTLSMAGLDR